MKVRLFASLRELAGASEIDVDASTLRELLEITGTRYGERWVAQVRSSRVIVGDRTLDHEDDLDAEIDHRAPVAILPPVAGGGYR